MVETFAHDANARNLTPEQMALIQEGMIASWGGYNLIGTRDQIVDGLAAMSRAGLDGILLSWPRFEQDMRRFQAETYPLLQQAGLRDFVAN